MAAQARYTIFEKKGMCLLRVLDMSCFANQKCYARIQNTNVVEICIVYLIADCRICDSIISFWMTQHMTHAEYAGLRLSRV